MPTSRKYIEIAYVFVISANVFLIPFGKRASIFALTAWGVCAALYIAANFNRLTLPKQSFSIYLALCILLLTLFVSIQFGTDKAHGYSILGTMLVIPVIPLLLFFSRDYIQKYKSLLLKFFIAGNISSLLFQIYKAVNSVYILKTARFLEKFFYNSFSVFLHPSYASMTALLAILAIIYLYVNELKYKQFRIQSAIVSLISFLLLSIGIYLYSSVAGIITYFIVMATFLIYLIFFRKKTFVLKLITLIGLSFGTILLLQNERFQIKLQKYNEIFQNSTNKTDTRIELWKSALEIGIQNPLFGTSPGDVVSDISSIRLTMESYNAHNQFLEMFASSGLIGLSIFILLIFLILKRITQSKARVLFAAFSVLNINFLFESILVRYSGALIFGYIIGIVLLLPSINQIVKKK